MAENHHLCSIPANPPVLYNEKRGTRSGTPSRRDRLNAVRREIAKVIVGQDDVVEGLLICLLAGGHVLLEGVPGWARPHCSARWLGLCT